MESSGEAALLFLRCLSSQEGSFLGKVVVHKKSSSLSIECPHSGRQAGVRGAWWSGGGKGQAPCSTLILLPLLPSSVEKSASEGDSKGIKCPPWQSLR